MSNTRRQLERWLKTLDIKGNVLDVGGLTFPVKGRTRTWDVDYYVIADIKKTYKGRTTDRVWDFNIPIEFGGNFANVFCLEMMEYVYNPMVVINNLNKLLKIGGRLFISTHFLFPHHSGGGDYLRFTRDGISKLLETN